jgi:ribonuclease P protein subunit POP4
MLQKADFHGALLKVVRSKCSSLVGVQGIILMDTKGTFQIICKDNRVKSESSFLNVACGLIMFFSVIAKHSCLFEILLEDITISVFGKHFVCKPAERTTKKVKTRLIKDLI